MTTQETLTFANFRPGIDEVSHIGATADRPGVEQELRNAFGLDEDATLKDLVGVMAPHSRLQENIAFGVEVLGRPEVQERLGYPVGTSPFLIAGKLCTRTGLQDTVARPLLSMGPLAEKFDAAIMPDRVPNWVGRMAKIAIEQTAKGTDIEIKRVTAVLGGEKPASQDAMEQAVHLDMKGIPLIGVRELLNSADKSGRGVMRTAARHLDGQLDLATAKILLPTVAGNWMQTGVQALESIREFAPTFDTDPENPQLYVVANHFPLDETGDEPTTTHQNPISALGNAGRGFVLLDGLRR